ncbi:unnamed protein product [Parnassius apollo]|uniref:(apollo) hypothetical protein n=1 Tax=Parnassius apollo TaxID=110799 RepID=A0A8S3XYP0_PARAO|nr:unnamed protein product [Parnassius apollo]
MDYVFKDCTLYEAISVLEDEEAEPALIYIEPPDPAALTDEDSADEDEGALANNLSGRQLNARCEVRLAPRRSPSPLVDFSKDKESPVASTSRSLTTRGRGDHGRRHSRGRGRSRMLRGKSTRYQGKTTNTRDSSSSSVSDALSDDNSVPVTRTSETENLGTRRSEGQYDPRITVDELVAFIAILINSGYNTVPSKTHYWDQHDDMRNNLVYNCMRQQRNGTGSKL